jgi:DNA-binding transcriptional ArsR family regulator
MKDGPNIAAIAALLGDPARANMLTALMHGQALTATELAQEAGVVLSTASGHLGKLQDAGLVDIEKQGRHRYFRLSGADVAAVLEGLMGVAARTGHLRVRTGPRDPELRRARVCYDHLAGDAAVRMYDRLQSAGMIAAASGALRLTKAGERFFSALGIDLEAAANGRRPLCRACLDWSERRPHIAGTVGAALCGRFLELGWVERRRDTRALTITAVGRRGFIDAFGFEMPAS